MNKKLLIIPAALLLLSSSIAFAGGSNVMIRALNTGTALNDGVKVRVTAFNPNTNSYGWDDLTKYAVDPSGYEKIGIMPRSLDVKFIDPIENQHCKADGSSTTDEYGAAVFYCFSAVPGTFQVGVVFDSNEPLYDGGPAANQPYFTTNAIFNRAPVNEEAKKVKKENKKSEDEEKKVEKEVEKEEQKEVKAEEENEPDEEVQALQNQVEELQTKIDEQDQKINYLTEIINKLKQFFSGLF